jgi:tRNA 2-thiouridine synthesizing protein A
VTEPAADTVEVDAEVDATGLSCPMPVIELARAVDGLEVGGVVRLLATDPAAKVDVPVWCRMQRQKLRSRDEQDGRWTFLVQKVR